MIWKILKKNIWHDFFPLPYFNKMWAKTNLCCAILTSQGGQLKFTEKVLQKKTIWNDVQTISAVFRRENNPVRETGERCIE